jgi:hypothetical protein
VSAVPSHASALLLTLPGAAALVTALGLTAAPPPPAPAAPPPPTACAGREYHQFDFWVGAWEVRRPDGQYAGANTITQTLGGCVLQEHWRGARGGVGTSVNIYDATRKRWHQTWVDNSGLLLELEGGIANGSMVLAGQTLDSSGAVVLQRITWTPSPSGTVRQHWESSSDGGATWTTAFDGTYSRSRRRTGS